MIPPIHTQLSTLPPLETLGAPCVSQERYASTLSSMECSSTLCFPCRMVQRFFSWIGSWIAHWYNAIMERVAPSTKELEIFQELLEGAFRGAALLLYDRNEGLKIISGVAQKCHHLYGLLGKKWFPKIEGIHFLRINLMRIALRCHAALGHHTELDTCKKELSVLGGEISDHLEKQIHYFSYISKQEWKPQTAMKVINFLTQSTANLLSKSQ